MIFVLILNFCTYGFLMLCSNGRIFNLSFSVVSSYDSLMFVIWFWHASHQFSFFDVFHVTCFINFIISLSGQYFKQLSPYFCRHSESASKGKVVLATAPKQHCNVEWCPPDSPPKGAKDYWHTKIYVCFFWCELLCVRCWNSHVVRKWLQYPTLMPWCGTLFFFFLAWRVQALLAWSGAHGSLDQGPGVLPLQVVCHHGSAQENTSCDKWHTTCINLLDGWFANNSQRWISIAAKISGWCGNCLQFMWCGYCLQFQFMYNVHVYIYIYTMLYYIGMIQDLITFKNTIKQAYLKSARGNGQHSFKRVHSGHLDADICVSVEPQQVLDRCTAWRMWPIAIARKRRRSSFTLKLNWENGSWRLPFASMLCVFFPFVFSICCEEYWRILLNEQTI